MLTATRSLSDVKNEPSPYRMLQSGLLPKFGPRKKADATGSPPPDVGAYEGEAAKENLGEGSGDRKDAGCSLKSESSREPWLAGWWRRLFGRKRRRESDKPVQAEFTLDLVKVIRNDLSDADAARALASAATPKKSKPKVEESVFGASGG